MSTITPVGALLQSAFKAYRGLFAQLAILIAVLYIPFFLLAWIAGVPERLGVNAADRPVMQAEVTEEVKGLPPEELPVQRSPETFARVSGLSFIGILISLVLLAAVAWLVENYTRGETRGWMEALRFGASRFWALAVTALMTSIVLFGAALLLIVPAIILGIYFAPASYAAALRGKMGWAAMDYSGKLVKGDWWRVFGRLILFSLVAVAAGFVVNAFFMILKPLLEPLGLFLVLPFLTQQLLNMFPVIGLALLFFDLEKSKLAGPAGL